MSDRMKFLVPLMLLVLVVGACNDEDPPQVVTPAPIVEPRTPQELMASFQTAYETMDAAAYLGLLDSDYLFVLREETALRFPDLGETLDLAEERRIHERMFSGSSVVDPDGGTQPALLGMGFLEFRALDGWNGSDDPARFPDTVWAPFGVDFLFDCGQEFATYKALGTIKVYARRYTRLVGGKEVYSYRMAGVVDLTESGKGVERTSLGLIKAFYR